MIHRPAPKAHFFIAVSSRLEDVSVISEIRLEIVQLQPLEFRWSSGSSSTRIRVSQAGHRGFYAIANEGSVTTTVGR